MDRKFTDKRTVDRYLSKGMISRQDYEKFLAELPDEEANAEWVQMELHDTELPDGALDEV